VLLFNFYYASAIFRQLKMNTQSDYRILGEIINMSSFRRLLHFQILRLATATLFFLIWGSLAFCGEIHALVQVGELAKLKIMIKNNPALVASKDKYDQTPLHLAAFAGRKDVVELLLANKSDVNAKSSSGETPLHVAVMRNNKEIVKLLLANKANVNAKANNGSTPLRSVMAFSGFKEMVELLHQHGGHD
jgi:ankyrin repeat protein